MDGRHKYAIQDKTPKVPTGFDSVFLFSSLLLFPSVIFVCSFFPSHSPSLSMPSSTLNSARERLGTLKKAMSIGLLDLWLRVRWPLGNWSGACVGLLGLLYPLSTKLHHFLYTYFCRAVGLLYLVRQLWLRGSLALFNWFASGLCDANYLAFNE